MTEQRAKYLLSLYFRQGCSPAEQVELDQWIHDTADDDTLRRILQEVWSDFAPADYIESDRALQMLSHILTPVDQTSPAGQVVKEPPANARIRTLWRRWIAAAAILIIACPITYLY